MLEGLPTRRILAARCISISPWPEVVVEVPLGDGFTQALPGILIASEVNSSIHTGVGHVPDDVIEIIVRKDHARHARLHVDDRVVSAVRIREDVARRSRSGTVR